jgi:hypothetical protein
MNISLYNQITRQNPGYSAGVQHGTDIGLRIGLDAICREMARQGDAARDSRRHDPRVHA